MLSFFNGAQWCYLSCKSYGQMNVWCFLSLFFGCWNFCFPLTGWFFQLRGLKTPTDVVIEWNAFISWSSKMSRAPSDILAMIPPTCFHSPLTPLVSFCRFPEHARETPGQSMQGRHSSRWAQRCVGELMGFFLMVGDSHQSNRGV